VTADTLLAALDLSFARRISFSVATVLEGENLACRAFAGLKNEPTEDSQTPAGSGPSIFHRSFEDEALQKLAEQSLTNRQPLEKQIEFGQSSVKARADYRPARPALGIFGAGDDAQPLLRLAKNLGWFVSVADGRSHLATPQRFPSADQISVLPMDQLPGSLAPQSSSATSRAAFAHLQREDAVVVMTHSFEQDAKILACLLASEAPPAYIGVLGPQRRTRELLAEAATLLHLPPTETSTQPDRWLARLHAPTGLDLGAEAPETIALSILAEIQKFRAKASALPMRQVRAASVALAG
jgi:xanthine/CO dehydrogenase XdhC/CoxF family maturation factor